MKKKILFISPLPPPYYGSALSSEMCLEILRESNNFEVRNIKINYSKEMSDIGKFNLSKITGFFHVKKQIKKQIKEFQPDLVYLVPATDSFGLIRDNLLAKTIKRHSRKKIVLHIRSRLQEKNWNNPFKRYFYRKLLNKTKVIVLGEQLTKDVDKVLPRRDILILPNAIQNEISEKRFSQIIKKRNIQKKYNILFLSNMDVSKGWFKLLQACTLMKRRNLNFHCNFVGDWPSDTEKKLFFNYLKKNNLEKFISYLGRKTGKDKLQILSDSNVLVFPTEYSLETFGRVIVEGMMLGLPVIANSIATIPNLVEHNKTGYLLQENSPEEIAEYLEKLFNQPKLTISMGKLGRKKFLSEFELTNYKKRFLDILQKI